MAGGLSGAFIVLLGLGLWYGWRSATYLWALQWSVYAAGILLLWGWLALHPQPGAPPRLFEPQAALLILLFILWSFAENLKGQGIFHTLPSVMPALSDIGLILSRRWAPLFVWLSVSLPAVWLLLLLSWKKPSVP
ncbi:MAG: hypothetical protein RMK19_00235 [Bacteroidia bacterium]|nr:hypothetical protein [Bacteroidia bacterium]MDW8014425.1 hypothetical protein [Bacteroidia bacterium]